MLVPLSPLPSAPRPPLRTSRQSGEASYHRHHHASYQGTPAQPPYTSAVRFSTLGSLLSLLPPTPRTSSTAFPAPHRQPTANAEKGLADPNVWGAKNRRELRYSDMDGEPAGGEAQVTQLAKAAKEQATCQFAAAIGRRRAILTSPECAFRRQEVKAAWGFALRIASRCVSIASRCVSFASSSVEPRHAC